MLYIIKIVSLFGAIITVLAFLPALTLPPNFTQSIAQAISYAYNFNHIVDIDMLMIVFTLFLVAEGVLIIWRGFKFFLFLFK